MFYFVIFVLLMVYALVKWLILRASPYVLFVAGVWVIKYLDFTDGALIILGAGFLLLALSRARGRDYRHGITGAGEAIQSEREETRTKTPD